MHKFPAFTLQPVLARRLLALIGVMLMIAAVAAALAPPQSQRRDRSAPTVPRPPASAAPPAAGGRTVHAELNGAESGTSEVVRARVGDVVDLEVTVPAPGNVTIQDYDLVEPADPSTPARFEFFADRAGRFDVRFEDARAPLGRVVVSAAP